MEQLLKQQRNHRGKAVAEYSRARIVQSHLTVGARIAVVLNPRSGSAPDRVELTRKLQMVGIDADLHRLPAGNTREWLTQTASRYDVLVAAGGDGTVSAVAAVAAASRKALGVLPAGTLNHFARDAGIPLDLEEAVAVLARGSTTQLDVGTVNDTVFINNASIGAYPRMVWERNQARKRGVPKGVASVLAIAATWVELSAVTARLCVDSVELVRRSPFVVVGNGEYDVEGLQLGRRRALTGSNLSLYVAPDLGRLDAIALPVRALLGTLKQHEKFEAWTARSVTIDIPRRDVDVALDGEIMRFSTPLRFGVRPRALEVIVPSDGSTR